MIRLNPWFLRSCLILIALMASSCLDVREEFWIHEDRSADAEFTCHMPRTATLAVGGPDGIRTLVEHILEKESCVDSYEVTVSQEQKRLTLKIRCKLNDVLDFEKLRDAIKRQSDMPEPVRKMVGEFDIKLAGLSGISVKRTVTPGEAVPALRWLPKGQVDGHRIVKILHYPRAITNHNAMETCDDGCTLIWEHSLAEAIQFPMVYQFVMPVAIPWGWILAGTVGAVAMAILLFKAISRRRKRPRTA